MKIIGASIINRICFFRARTLVSQIVPLSGSASHIYLLMAGSTNPMQSRHINGRVIIQYTDDAKDTLQLCNAQNWWPIKQDYLIDDYAFTTGVPFPLRLNL